MNGNGKGFRKRNAKGKGFKGHRGAPLTASEVEADWMRLTVYEAVHPTGKRYAGCVQSPFFPARVAEQWRAGWRVFRSLECSGHGVAPRGLRVIRSGPLREVLLYLALRRAGRDAAGALWPRRAQLHPLFEGLRDRLELALDGVLAAAQASSLLEGDACFALARELQSDGTLTGAGWRLACEALLVLQAEAEARLP